MTTTAVRGTARATARTRVGSRVPGVVVASLTAAGLGLLLVQTFTLLAWASDGRSDVAAGAAAKAGLVGWLSAHKVPVELGTGTVGIAPLGLTFVVALLLARAGTTVAKASGAATAAAAIRAGALVAVPYAVLAGLASGLARVGDVAVPGARAVATVGVLAALAGAAGGLRAYGVDRVRASMSVPVTAWVRATAAGLVVLLGGGLIGFVASLSWHAGRAVDLIHAVDAGLLGGLLLVLACLLLVPNAAVWAAAYAVGTGFAVGVGTGVAPSGVEIGNVPSIPILAALPGAGPAPRVSLLLFVVPLLAGGVIGWTIVRYTPAVTAGRAALLAGGAGAAAGLVVAVSCWLAGGSMGPGRLAEAGPDPLLTGLAAAEWLGFAGAAAAAVFVRLSRSGR